MASVTSTLDFRSARVIWTDEEAAPIEDIDVALSNGWAHLRTQAGHVSSYPANQISRIDWKGSSGLQGASELAPTPERPATLPHV
jgi:hypothetical protein